MTWNEISEKLMLEVLRNFFLGMIALRLLLRPRKPQVIYMHFNRNITKVLFLPITAFFFLLYIWIVLTISLKLFAVTAFQTGIFSVILSGLVVLNTIYVLYWSQPFSRKRTGVKVVDEAVERYRKPEERAVGIGGGWCPDLVVDGASYKLITYTPKKVNSMTGLLAFNPVGEVVRDQQQMGKIKRCYQFATKFSSPELINERTRIYVNAMKVQKAWESVFKDFEQFSQMVFEEKKNLSKQVEVVMPMLEIAQRMGKDMMKYFEQEAQWGNQCGNTRLKAVTHEDALEMNRIWRETFGWLMEESAQFEEGLEAGKKILGQLEKMEGRTRTVEAVRLFLRESLPRYKALSMVWAGWKEKGEVQERFYGKLDEDEIHFWQSRLEWVDKVDAKRKSK